MEALKQFNIIGNRIQPMSEPKQSWFYQNSHRHEIDPYWDSKDPQYYNRQVEKSIKFKI